MTDALPSHKVAAVKAALAGGMLSEEQPIAAFLDLDGIRASVAALHDAFPAHCLHTFAAKASTIHRVLELLRDNGMGCEVASPVELAAAIRAGFPPERIVFDSPAKTRAEFAEQVNDTIGHQQVTTIDIGGGLPVNFESETVTPTYAAYAAILAESVPLLFSGKYRVVTEFGRSIMAKNGFIVARVEYTKETGGRSIAISHAGAHTATRTVFMP